MSRFPLLAHLAPPLLVAAGLFGFLPPLPQPQEYHRFADPHVCFGMPRCADFFSNVPFGIVGVIGLLALRRLHAADMSQPLRLLYRMFFFGLVLTGFASAYYHLSPSDARLAWDRAAIVLTLTAWLSIVIGERYGVRLAARLWPLLLFVGLASVTAWIWGEAHGKGDLRAYLFFQALAFLWALAALLPSRSMPTQRPHFAALLLYALALICDFYDRALAEALGFVSGHTLKHLLAAAASAMPLWILFRRQRP
ncbi:MAG: hypothetical protein N2441_06100 [Rhodocyclaceae bacterium]|nr:hypothetical protein [Rhodocyclaceae bacterium]